jgi:two-component system LytT family response regulator
MYRTIIVEDDVKHIRSLKKMVHEHCPQIEIVGEAKNVTDAYKLINELGPDLVFLDIILHKQTAFDLLDKLMPFDFEVIFITSYEKYTLKAIKYAALDYLIKPLVVKELQAATKKAVKRIFEKYVNHQLDLLMTNVKAVQNNLNQKIAVPTVEGFVFIQMQDIIRCEAHGAYTYIFTNKKDKVIASKNIKEYEEILPKNFFFRIHNSHLININRMLRYNKGRGGTVTMEDGTQIEVASRRRGEFLKLFGTI